MRLTLDQADALVRREEERRGLLRHTADGWSVWPLVRQLVCFRLNETSFDAQTPPRVGRDIPALLALLGHDLRHFVRLPQREVLVMSVSSNRSERNEAGLYEDVFFDRLLAERNSFYKMEQVADPDTFARNRSAWFPSGLTTTVPRALAAVLPAVADVRELGLELERAFGPAAPDVLTLGHLASRFVWRKRMLKGLFRRVRPRVLLMVTAYSDQSSVAAARELGIPVVEFQHGCLYSYHPGYSWHSACRPFRPQMAVPDRIFLYGEYWRDQLLPNGFYAESELVSAGSLRMDRYRSQPVERDPREVLITTQGLDTDNLLAFLARVRELAPDLRLTVKLHPIDYHQGERFKLALPGALVVGPAEDPSTFQLLTRCGWHASISSTCHYEALGLNCPTIVLPLLSADWSYAMLAEFEGVLTPQSPEDLVTLLNQAPPRPSGARLFVSGALERMQSALAELLR